MARVPLLDEDEVPAEYQYLLETDVGAPDLFRALANAPELWESNMRYSGRLWDALPVRERELVILAAARALESRYEWHHHVRLGRDAGLEDAEIDAVSRGDLAALDEVDAALVSYARGVALGDLGQAEHDRLEAQFDSRTVVAVAMLAGFYVATSRTADALAVEPEEEFVGWEL